jgi:hypothetical protein
MAGTLRTPLIFLETAINMVVTSWSPPLDKRISSRLRGTQQFRQSGDVAGNAPSFVVRE